jgi:hypothetical protein
MSRVIAALTAAIVWCAAPTAAATITFDLTGSQLIAPDVVFDDVTATYSLTARGMEFGGSILAGYNVDRDAFGVGVNTNAIEGGDTGFIENSGPNERLQLDLGANAWRLVSVQIENGGLLNPTLRVFSGPGFFTVFNGEVDSGVLLFPVLSASTKWDFTSLGTGDGLKLAAVTFDDGVDASVPEPATAVLLITGMASLAVRRRRSRRARRTPPIVSAA